MNILSVAFGDLTFVDVHDPKELELKHLRTEYNISKFHLEDYINRKQVPKIEEEKDYILIVLDIPFLDDGTEEVHQNGNSHTPPEEPKQPVFGITDLIPKPSTISNLIFGKLKQKRIRTAHVNFFVGQNFLVVLHDDKTPEVDHIFTECQKTLVNREEYMGQGPNNLFFSITNALINSSFKVMNELSGAIDDIDLRLIKNKAPGGIVEEISVMRRNIVYFKSMVTPAISIFADLSTGKFPGFEESSSISWSSMLDHLQKIKYRLDGNRELIEGIASSYESLLTARSNEIMKVLTMFTAILLPLTFLASVYGMNIIGLPKAEDPDVLLILSTIMAVIASFMVLIFKISRWL
ncbi:MAG: magnesium transporter CorA family protein [Candidatus Daviesbacteria bacterium]|nr:magnesium transporter CorA family protein [Candidatus Daviesbacteria bacterium]